MTSLIQILAIYYLADIDFSVNNNAENTDQVNNFDEDN